MLCTLYVEKDRFKNETAKDANWYEELETQTGFVRIWNILIKRTIIKRMYYSVQLKTDTV